MIPALILAAIVTLTAGAVVAWWLVALIIREATHGRGTPRTWGDITPTRKEHQ